LTHLAQNPILNYQQASIHQELAQNACFESLTVQRRGRSTEKIKWQISGAKYYEIFAAFKDGNRRPGSYCSASPNPSPIGRFELPGSEVTPIELDASEFSGPRTTTSSAPPEGQALPCPYSLGFDFRSDSLYEAQFPLSFGGIGSYATPEYSVLGSATDNKDPDNYSLISEPGSERNISPATATHPDSTLTASKGTTDFLQRSRRHNQTLHNGKSGSEDRVQAIAASSANLGAPQGSTKGKEKASTSGPGNNLPNGNNDDDDDGDDDGNGRKRKRFRSPPRGQDRRRFACPYHRHDPETFGVGGERRYLVCAGASFRYISELM
jgi:hypothetical protein